MRLKSMLLAGALTLTLLLSGCGARPLPQGVDEATAGSTAEEIVALLMAGDYQAVVDAFDPTIKEDISLTADDLNPVMEPVLNSGDYISTYKVMVVGSKSKDYDGEYVTVGIYCEHEKIDVIYELYFDTDLELIGLQTKQQRRSFFGN